MFQGISIRSRWCVGRFIGEYRIEPYSTETIIIKLQKFLQKQNFWKPLFVAAVVLKTINVILFTIQFNGKHCKRDSAICRCRNISRTFDVFSETLSATYVHRPFLFSTRLFILFIYLTVSRCYPNLCILNETIVVSLLTNFSDCSSA